MNLVGRFSKLTTTCLAAALFACAGTANAQSFVDTASVAIDDTTLCAGATGTGTTANVSRTFAVTGLSTVTDLNVGLIATHTWRGDMRVTLTPPAGTGVGPVILINEDTSNTGNVDDYNIELDDEAIIDVNTGTTDSGGPHDVSDAPYAWSVRPDGSLSAFDGIDPNGTWTLDICDDYAGETGTYTRGELVFQQPNVADLSLSLTAATSVPEAGTVLPLTLVLSNGGSQSATSTVSFSLPAGVTYDGQSGDGAYDEVTSIWTPPANIANGGNATIIIDVIVTTATSYTLEAEIETSNQPDPDSTPGNSDTSEDDYSATTVFGQASTTKPGLTCPVSDRFTHAWAASGANSWPAGATTPQSYPPTGTAVPAGEERLVFELTGDTLQLGASSGVNTPVVQTNVTGGISPADPTLHIAVDYALQSQSLTMEVDVGEPTIGVDSLQFSIFDVDLGGWIDRITVTGSLDGVDQPVTLTPSGANFIDGNAAVGLSSSTNTTDNGNIDVTFLTPIDNLKFVYDNHPDVGINPAFQIISLHDITTCPRTVADLNASKTVEVYDPGGLGLYMTPGNEVLYKIIVTNSATATADAEDVDINDTLPTNLKFVSASATGFIGGAFGSPDLPAPNTDCGVTTCLIRFSGGDVPINTTGEIQVRAMIK